MARVAKLPVTEADDRTRPICPHCDAEITGVVKQTLDEPMGKAYVWMCGRCRKVLGVSHRKGFWMG